MTFRTLFSTAALLALSACSMAPPYARPTTPLPATFKETPGWTTARPADAIAKGQWWKLFGDPVLDALEARVVISNQNVAAYAAAYAEARATVREAHAALFPTIDLNGSAQRSGSFGSTTIVTNSGTTSVQSGGSRSYSVSLGASWAPDLWGKVGGTVRQDKALAQASEGDLNNAILSAQGELASDYVQLRGYDRQKEILDETVKAYADALRITTNRYNSGVVSRLDVEEAKTQLTNARASAADLVRQRQILEHAIAVLVGETPSRFSILPTAWAPVVPDVPGVLPSELLQRRPDVAAAERRAAAANQYIGVQRAAFFPTIDLSGDVGTTASRIASLFTTASSFWTLGATAAETLLDFGARSARVAEARAAFDQQVANYRQAVLTAFQNVEDELVASRILKTVAEQRALSTQSANRAEQIARNQYLSGQIAYTDVITQQTSALSARQSEAQAQVDRQTAAISLIQAIGGSWTTPPRP